jgi:hypothetical protein
MPDLFGAMHLKSGANNLKYRQNPHIERQSSDRMKVGDYTFGQAQQFTRP